jgi:hypothetical protein
VSEFSEGKKWNQTPDYVKERILARCAVEAAAIRVIAEADISYLNDQPMNFEQLREVSAFISDLGREALKAERRLSYLENGVTLHRKRKDK